MKKLGLRVLAGGLAVLMAVSVLAPAKVASAENDLLIAPASTAALNTLYITADMVDGDNEIVISGENWDRIVVQKEAAAANIYFDEVEVGELVVESGSNSVIQLWDVDAGKVTVKEPELKEIDMTGLRVLLAEEETRQQAVDYFMRVQAENEKALHQAPKLITMEDAVVDTISAGAGIRLDLHEGDVKALKVEASAKLDRMDVTLEGYSGDVVYQGNEGFSVVNLKNVDSRINKLTVDTSNTNNYLNISSRNSVALNVEVAGDAKVALNIPMGELTIAETAKAAQVDVLNAVDSMNVAADNAKVEIAPIGNIAQASITGDKVMVSGTGVLTEVVILGKDAYVSTKGTDVEGENTYVEPVYAEPKVVVKDTYDNMTAGSTTLTKNSDGSATISFSGQYQTASFNVPATVDVNRIRSITVEVTTRAQFGLSIVTKGGEAVVNEYPGYNITEETKKEFTYYINPAEQKIGKIGLMSLLKTGQPDMVLNSVTFVLYDEGKAPTPKPTPPPAAPSELNLPAGSKEWQFADMLPCEGWGNTVSEAVNNGIKAEYERQYACTKFTLPEALTVGDFEKIIVTASSSTGPVGIELYDETDAKIGFWWNKKATETTDLALTYSTTGYGGDSSIGAADLAKQVAKVNVMYHGDGEGAEIILYRIAFVAKPGAGSGDTPTTAPEEGTACTTDKWAVHTFTGYDLRDYAGTTVEISVDMRKTGGSSAAKAHVQLNDSQYTGIAYTQSITDEWTNFSYTYDVPAAFADETSPVYFGFRTLSDEDYSEYTFFYKDFTFTGTPVGGEDTPTPTPTPSVTETPEPTPEVTETPTPTPGVTETPTTTPDDPTPTPTPGVTETPEPTPEATPTPVPPIVVKGADMTVSKADGAEVESATDDAVTITFSGQYKSAVFAVPEDVDIDRIKEITLNVTTDAHFGLTLISKQGEGRVDYPGYGISETVTRDFSYQIDPNEWKINRIQIGSLDADQSPLTLNSITFTLYDKGEVPEATPTTPEAPSVLELSGESKEYKFADLELVTGEGNSWGYTVSEAEHDGVKAVYSGQYACTKFALSEALTLGDFEKVILTASSGKGSFGIELYGEDGKVAFWWAKNAKDTTDLELAFNGTGYNGNATLDSETLAKQINQVNIMYCVDGADAEIILYRVAFIAK